MDMSAAHVNFVFAAYGVAACVIAWCIASTWLGSCARKKAERK